MSRKFFPLFIAAGLAILLGGCGGGGGGSRSSSVTAPDPNAIRIACLGDSITAGTDLDKPQYDSYPFVLARQLGRTYHVGNFGEAGSGVLTAVSHAYRTSNSYQKALAFKPQIVVVALGTNDSRVKFKASTQAEFTRDYKALLADLKVASPTAQFFVCLPPPIYMGDGTRNANLHDNVLPLIKQIAQDTNAIVIDLNTLLQNQPKLFDNGIHPTKAGAVIIATEVKRAINQQTVPNSPIGIESAN